MTLERWESTVCPNCGFHHEGPDSVCPECKVRMFDARFKEPDLKADLDFVLDLADKMMPEGMGDTLRMALDLDRAKRRRKRNT